MGACGCSIHNVVEIGEDGSVVFQIRNADGTMGGSLRLYEGWKADGSVCAQFELRFEDQSSLVTIAELGLADEGHEAGRSWVLVKMEPRKSFSEPLRFSIDIPGKPASTGNDTGHSETTVADIIIARQAIQTVRAGCGNPNGCDYPLCDLAQDRSVRQLADDGCEPVVESLASQSLHSSDSGT